MKRKTNRPAGRADHARWVERITQTAAEAMLMRVLEGIRADPEAGAWGDWAAKMLEGDKGREQSGREK